MKNIAERQFSCAPKSLSLSARRRQYTCAFKRRRLRGARRGVARDPPRPRCALPACDSSARLSGPIRRTKRRYVIRLEPFDGPVDSGRRLMDEEHGKRLLAPQPIIDCKSEPLVQVAERGHGAAAHFLAEK